MKYVYRTLMLILAIKLATCRRRSISSEAIVTLKNDNGTVTSPEYPENYGNDVVQRVHIEAKPGHVITLKFYTFDVEDADEGGARTDFVRLVDGEVGRSDPFRMFLYGNLTTPFYLTSKTSRIRFRFTSNNNGITRQGFKFDYRVHAVPPVCSPDSDENEVEEADIFTSCDPIDRGDPSQCVAGCPDDYLLAEANLKTCIDSDSTFVPQTCVDSDVLARCENSNLTDCPYTFNEISKIYETLAESATDEQLALLLANVGRGGSGDCAFFCRRHPTLPRYKPKNCGKFPAGVYRDFCLVCRMFACTQGYFG